jgi:hypothetical protein
VSQRRFSPCGLFSRAEDKVKLSDDEIEEAFTSLAIFVELYFTARRRSQRSVKPKHRSSGLCCMGNSSGDETNSPVIRVFDDAGNVIQTQEQAGEFKEW